MRIIDEHGIEITDPDERLGYTTDEIIVSFHHPEEEAVPEVSHYEVEEVFPNGGRSLRRVVDIPGKPAQEAWDEYEDILRWHWYTPEQIAEREAREREEREAAERAWHEMRRAETNIPLGSIFQMLGPYYKATLSIARGEERIPGINCEAVAIEDILNAINS